MNNNLISREALKKKIEEVQYTQEFCIEHQIDYSISMQMLGMVIDNAPTVDYPFYQEAYQTGYEEGKNERPQGEWGKWVISEIRCPNCLEYFEADCYSKEELKKCPNCGADMRGKQ